MTTQRRRQPVDAALATDARHLECLRPGRHLRQSYRGGRAQLQLVVGESDQHRVVGGAHKGRTVLMGVVGEHAAEGQRCFHVDERGGLISDTTVVLTTVSDLAADPVHRGGRPLPTRSRTRSDRTTTRRHDPWVAPDFLRALRVPEQVRVVPLLPDEHEMRSRHVIGDEGTTYRGAGERIGANAVPPEKVLGAVVCPEMLVFEGCFLVEQQGASLWPLVAVHRGTITTAARRVPGREDARRAESPSRAWTGALVASVAGLEGGRPRAATGRGMSVAARA